MSPKSLAKPAMFVDSARSADMARNSGRPYSFLANAFTQAPQAPRAARFGCLSPGFAHIELG